MGEVSVLYLSEGVSFSLVAPRLPWHLLALLLGDNEDTDYFEINDDNNNCGIVGLFLLRWV